MAFLLLAQLGMERGGLGVQASQFGFLAAALKVPGMGRVTGIVTLDLQQLDLTAHGSQVGLLGGVGLPQVTDLVAAGIELCIKAVLRHLRSAQALLQQ
ncbi:hypothetical protein D3C80_1385910 [compost metagenome]